MMERTSLFPALLIAWLVAPSSAQDLGRGSLGPNGLEPRLLVRGAAAPGAARIEVLDLAPAIGGSPVVNLVFSAGRGRLPLDGLGLPGAVVGLDLSWTSVVGPFQPATGQLVLDVPVSPGFEGFPLTLQAYVIDARIAGPLPLALSDSTSVTLGSDAPPVVALRDGALPGTLDVVRFLEDGRPALSLPDLEGLQVRALTLASIGEERRLRPDLPAPAPGGLVRLPDGSRLLHYAHPGRRVLGLAHVRRDGTVVVVHEVPDAPVGGHPALDAHVAASPHGPYVAFVTFRPAPRVHLYRTDGRNLPGLAEPVVGVGPGFLVDVEGTSLVFGREVLAIMDLALGPALVELATLGTRNVVLPPTSAGPPAVFDEEVGVSGDGRRFVFGAGPTRRWKDVYVVRDDGVAWNVTNQLQDYGEVGYGDPGRLSELTLNEDGSAVGYVTNSTPEPEAFLRILAQPSALHMTENQTFSQSIDVGAIGRLPGLTAAALIYAGSSLQQLDVFYTPTGQRNDLVNLTASGPNPQQRPFGLGGNLGLRDLGSLRAPGHVVVEAFDAALGQTVIHHLDLAVPAGRVALRGAPGPRLAHGPGAAYAAASGARLALLDPARPPATWRRELALPGAIGALHTTPTRDRLFAVVRAGAAVDELWSVDPATATAAPLLRPNGAILDVLAEHANGAVHVIVADGGGTRLVRVPTSGGPAANLGPSGLRSFLGGS